MNMRKLTVAALAALVLTGCGGKEPVKPTEITEFDYESNVGVKGKVFYGEKPASGVEVTITMLSPQPSEEKVTSKADGTFSKIYRMIADNGADFTLVAEIENEYIGHWKSELKTVHADKEEMAEVDLVMSEVGPEPPSGEPEPPSDEPEEPEGPSQEPEE